MKKLTIIVGLVLLFTAHVYANCTPDCAGGGTYSTTGKSVTAPYCTGNSVTYTSVRGTQFTINFQKTYKCGQYADKTWWFSSEGQGSVCTQSATPAYRDGHNGHDVDPLYSENRLESDTPGNYAGAPDDPINGCYTTASKPRSLIKSVTRWGGNLPAGQPFNKRCTGKGETGCMTYNDVLTFVDQVPDSDGDNNTSDEFRPSYLAGIKAVHNTSEMNAALARWPMLSINTTIQDGVDAGWSIERARKFFQHPHCFFDRKGESGSYRATDNVLGQCYGGNRAIYARSALGRSLLEDSAPMQDSPRSSGRQSVINIAQQSIDYQSASEGGWRSHSLRDPNTPGGHDNGYKSTHVVGAFLLNDQIMITALKGDRYQEDLIVQDRNGTPFLGLPSTHSKCSNVPDNCSLDNIVQTLCIANGTNGNWDSACCSNSSKYYFRQWWNSAQIVYIVIKSLGAETIWDDDPYLMKARAFQDGDWNGKFPKGSGPAYTGGLYCGTSNHANMTNTSSTDESDNYFECSFCRTVFSVHKDYSPGPAPAGVSFLASTVGGVAPLPVTFTNTSTGDNTTWAWEFGDGGTSTEQSPTHTYSKAGTYTIKLTGSGGSSGTKTYTRTSYIDVRDASLEPITVEAETMTLNGYKIDTGQHSSGKYIMVDPNGSVSGTATYMFTGFSGTYTIDLHTRPEQDGAPQIKLFAGSNQVISETLPIESGGFNLGIEKIYTVTGVSIKNGDVIKIEGTADQTAFARVDKITLTPITTAVGINEVISAVESSRLLFTNPVIQTVTFSTNHHGALSIYDNTGKVIRSISVSTLDGNYIWDGTDNLGNKVTAGVYFYGDEQNKAMGKVVYIK